MQFTGLQWDDIDFDTVEDLDKYDRKKYLAPISVINLKKTPGKTTSNDSEIDKFAKDDREYIKNKLKYIDQTLSFVEEQEIYSLRTFLI
ncbi:hypothetical protein NH288_09465 [Anaerococcus sp. NML200537]|uniref:hypothetical protein n=1 Tax=Anaerococcus sp. NML200537 TaxID=2954485 RepID=UPI002237534D|nr:hypothetical protein [Anaerococcus sp. NML200537]MCW6702309.1 hypothetical protein [Anaerococcus sp. NML200537]